MEQFNELLNYLKDVDFTKVNSDNLYNDNNYKTLVERFKYLYTETCTFSESEIEKEKYKIIASIKNLIITKHTIFETNELREYTISYINNTNKKDHINTLGLILNNHSDMIVKYKLDYTDSFDTDKIDMDVYTKNHIIMLYGPLTLLSSQQTNILLNSLSGKILFLCNLNKDSYINKANPPFSLTEKEGYSKIKTDYKFDIFFNDKAKTLYYDNKGTPLLSYVKYNNGFIFQWIYDLSFNSYRELYEIDNILYSNLTLLLSRMHFIMNNPDNVNGNEIFLTQEKTRNVFKKIQRPDQNFEESMTYDENNYYGKLYRNNNIVLVGGKLIIDTIKKVTVDRKITGATDMNDPMFSKTYYYEENGYKGTINRVGDPIVSSGFPAGNKTVSITKTQDNSISNLPDKIWYSSENYTGWLYGDQITSERILLSGEYTPKTYLNEYKKGYFHWFSRDALPDFWTAAKNTRPSRIPNDWFGNSRNYNNYPKPSDFYGMSNSRTCWEVTSYFWVAGNSKVPATNDLTDSYGGIFWDYRWNDYMRFSCITYRHFIPAKDTRTYKTVYTRNYTGNVSRKDSRVWTLKYEGEIIKPGYDTRIWQETYQGVVVRQNNGFTMIDLEMKKEIDKGTTYKNDKKDKKIIILESARRHVIKIDDLYVQNNTFNTNSYMKSINILDKIKSNLSINNIPTFKCIALFCNEYLPNVIDEESIKYYFVINSEQFEIVPINSKRNGKKIIRTTEYYSDSEHTIYLKENIRQAYLIIKMDLKNKNFSPFISNIKILLN